jgi:hypothetical protein
MVTKLDFVVLVAGFALVSGCGLEEDNLGCVEGKYYDTKRTSGLCIRLLIGGREYHHGNSADTVVFYRFSRVPTGMGTMEFSLCSMKVVNGTAQPVQITEIRKKISVEIRDDMLITISYHDKDGIDGPRYSEGCTF